jgi:hypothetical protein
MREFASSIHRDIQKHRCSKTCILPAERGKRKKRDREGMREDGKEKVSTVGKIVDGMNEIGKRMVEKTEAEGRFRKRFGISFLQAKALAPIDICK